MLKKAKRGNMAKMSKDQRSELRWFMHDNNMNWSTLSNLSFGRMRDFDKMSFYEANCVRMVMREYTEDMEAG